MAEFFVRPGELWLVPARDCIPKGGKVQIFVFDADTEEPVDPSTLVFSTDTEGITVDANGLVSSTRDDDFVTIRARAVGGNGYRGQVRIRARCNCGAEMFDPALIVRANTSGPALMPRRMVSIGNLEVFGVSGQMEVTITGDYSNVVSRPFALDLISMQNDSGTGPACLLLTGGISGKYLGTQMMFSRPGTLSGVEDGANMEAGTYSESMLTYFLEDFGGPTRVLGARPTAPTHIRVVEMRDDHLLIELNGAFMALGFNSVGPDTDKQVFISARFEARLPDP